MTEHDELVGLTEDQAHALQQKYGKNLLTADKKENLFLKLFRIVAQPMFLLLIAASVIYFILGEPRDGAIMLVFVVGVISIDVIQECKTDKTLEALKDLSAPKAIVIRDGKRTETASENLVPGDVMILNEGDKIPADGIVVRSNDLCVDESSLTGESEGVWKIPTEEYKHEVGHWRRDRCYAGTLVTQGTGYIKVDAIGAETEYGRIGKNIAEAEAKPEPTPLQRQTGSLVNTCAVIAAALFVLVSLATWINISGFQFRDRFIESILSGITLAMAMIPEEFPVILTVFLSMGAWRLAKKNSLVRRLPSVETLGAVSVLCVDKTGTITQNRMRVEEVWAEDHDPMWVSEMMGLGCESDAYDPMEQAMLDYCQSQGISREHLFAGSLITEYSFTNELKMMGHVWHHDGEIVVAVKGSPERVLSICDMPDSERGAAGLKVKELSSRGLRVIAIGTQPCSSESDIPEDIMNCRLHFLGLVGLADPPRENVARDIALCRRAGIRVVMITGDNGVTASAIARKIGMANCENVITGEELDKMSDEELCKKVKSVSIFSRVVPEHKMRIVRAFKENGEIVAMTGDGVNDAPALKYADIGVAMGLHGSEVSREAADLILMDDNFSTIVDTVKDGRRIYDNIRRAVGYVFTIHIPIALSSLLPPILGIAPANLLLLPLHVVLLEIIIDPTCSVVLESLPAENNVMDRPPRDSHEKLIPAKALLKSIIQGLTVFAASFGMYYILLSGNEAPVARSAGLAVIMLSNLFLVFVNSSDNESVIRSAKKLAGNRVIQFSSLGIIAMLALILYTPLSGIFKLSPLNAIQLLTTVVFSAAGIFWYEIVKAIKRRRN